MGTTPVWAVDEDVLWLPSNHARLFLDLIKAAESAENLQRCVTVIGGTIDLDRSREGHPIYRILCRQESRLSYNELVDGVSFETLTTVEEKPEALSAEALEAARLAELARLEAERQAKIASIWSRCQQAFDPQMRLFRQFAWSQDMPPEPAVFDESVAEFSADFDSQNTSGQDLHYRLQCRVQGENPPDLSVKAR